MMRSLVNPISGSIAGAGGLLFVLLIVLNILLVEIREDEVMFLLVFLILIPMYLLILPLISLVGTLIDNSHPGKVKESVIHSCMCSVIGSMAFTLFLVLSVSLVTTEDGWELFTTEIGIGLPDMLLIVLVSNLASTSIGGIINGYRAPVGGVTSIDLDAYGLAPSTIVELVREDGPREYYNSLISKGNSTTDALRETMDKYPEWNPMSDN